MKSKIQLSHTDLADLVDLFPTLKFDRLEQIEALLCCESADFQAVPGSGKTTLLGAKLALVARRWKDNGRGVCILTHTNVAREEIEKILNSVPGANVLLSYPHYIGTIQTFVNKFVALPWLRSQGVPVYAIDDEITNRKIFKEAEYHHTVKMWRKFSERKADFVLSGLRYVGPDLSLETNSAEKLPGPGPTLDAIVDIKSKVAKSGYHKYDDIFAYAEQALHLVPNFADAVRYRFPELFIDEMQDTSDTQLKLLSTIFEDKCCVQRFGDVNQAILNSSASKSQWSFPKVGHFEVKNSIRFGKQIAGVVNRLKSSGEEIEGVGEESTVAPLFILYDDLTISNVIRKFGEGVAHNLDALELESGVVKAICAIKKPGNHSQKLGRYVGDYHSEYEPENGAPIGRKTVRELMQLASNEHGTEGTTNRVEAARATVLRLLQDCGKGEFRNAESWRKLILMLGFDSPQIQPLQMLVLRIVKGSYEVSTDSKARASLEQIVKELSEFIEIEINEQLLDILIATPTKQARRVDPNSILARKSGREVRVHLDTIAAVKGETHLATLVLESCYKKQYDLQSVLKYLCGDSHPSTADATIRKLLMNIFVAASRPKKILAFAVHVDRVDFEVQKKLKARGWRVLSWVTPSQLEGTA